MPSNLRRSDAPGYVHFWTISCYRRLGFFHNDVVKQVVIESLDLLRQKFRICLVGYVIMPEHIHVLLYPHPRGGADPVPISKLLHAFKQRSGYYAKARLRRIWREQGRLWSQALNDWALGHSPEQSVWNVRGYDFNIDRQATLIEKLEYCHGNPVTRGLVNLAEQWPWSSYCYYEKIEGVPLNMDWDGVWPIEW